MEIVEIVNQRLINQQIADSNYKSAQELVGWMGAMQAQDFNMSKWALGARLKGSTQISIEEAYNKGKILRTHLMRPTWHLVSSEDIYWMLELTVPRIKAASNTRHKELGLSKEIINKCFKILEKELDQHNHLTRDELVSELVKHKIATDNNRASHIFLCAEMEGLVCSGPIKNKKETFALLEKRVPVKKLFTHEESLKLLAEKYFVSHGPATIQDFIWWSGLKVSDAKKGLEIIHKQLDSFKTGQDIYWFKNSSSPSKLNQLSVYLLPAFDEYIIAYRNRDAVIGNENSKKTISSNGIFRPIIVINGKVSGIWRREIKKGTVHIEIDLFESYNDEVILLLKEQIERYGKFLGLKTEIQYKKQKPLK